MEQATTAPLDAATIFRAATDWLNQPANRPRVMKRLDWLAHFLDDAVRLPGTRYSIGWDGLVGLIPGVGDALTTLVSGYVLWEAHRLGVPKWTLWQMFANIVVDMLVGIVPVLGDLLDFTWKANRRNLQLLRRALEAETRYVDAASWSTRST